MNNLMNLWRRFRARFRQIIMLVLPLFAFSGVGIAWALYPVDNHFSVLTCTMSFLGSPDAHRNPSGWRFYQAGMTFAVLWLACLTLCRIGRRDGRPSGLVAVGTTAYHGALALILGATWIPLSRQTFGGGVTYGEIHNPVTIAGIIVMTSAIILDGISLLLARVRWPVLVPFAAMGLVTIAGLVLLTMWRGKCAADPSLHPFPGNGFHSTPLWEWIAFLSLVLFMGAQATLGRSPASPWEPPALSRRRATQETQPN